MRTGAAPQVGLEPTTLRLTVGDGPFASSGLQAASPCFGEPPVPTNPDESAQPPICPRKSPLVDLRFWSRVRKGEHCWIWESRRRGYGKITIAGHTYLAHRLSWEIHHGPIPDGLFVLHHCDNPPCVNPAHLFLGTAGDNNRDRAAKGRSVGSSTRIYCARNHARAQYGIRGADGELRCSECERVEAERAPVDMLHPLVQRGLAKLLGGTQ